MEISTVKTSRIEVVDSLRGFAIMAILLVHNVDHFFFPEFPVQTSPWLNLLDQLTVKTIFTLFSGKTYAIFTMLFGFTFYIQHTNQKKKREGFRIPLSVADAPACPLCRLQLGLLSCWRRPDAVCLRFPYSLYLSKLV